MVNEYNVPTLLEGVDPADIVGLAQEYEAFCRRFMADWKSKRENLPPVGAYSGNTWFDQLESRAKRYEIDVNLAVTQWWLEKGFCISIARDGTLTIGLVEQPKGTEMSVFIIDDNNRVCEIKDGKNISFADNHFYEVADPVTIHRIENLGDDPYVGGEFTLYESLEALEAVIGPVSPAGDPGVYRTKM